MRDRRCTHNRRLTATSAQIHVTVPHPTVPHCAGGGYERGAAAKKCHRWILSKGSLTGVSFRVAALSPGYID